jgi:hypothetical protein
LFAPAGNPVVNPPGAIPDRATLASNADGHTTAAGAGASTFVVSRDCTGARSNGWAGTDGSSPDAGTGAAATGGTPTGSATAHKKPAPNTQVEIHERGRRSRIANSPFKRANAARTKQATTSTIGNIEARRLPVKTPTSDTIWTHVYEHHIQPDSSTHHARYNIAADNPDQGFKAFVLNCHKLRMAPDQTTHHPH